MQTETGAALLNSTAVCRPPSNIESLPFDIYPVNQFGHEVLHIHTDEGVYEAFDKMGRLVYAAGDTVKVTSVSKHDVTLRNDFNEADVQVFKMPLKQFMQDFVVTCGGVV